MAETWNASCYRARYYDPNSGRFLTEDPERFHTGMNFYPYVSNSPADDTDPTGLYQLQGFPPDMAAEMTIAIGKLWAKLRENQCCIDPKLRDKLLDILQPGNGDGGATFVYAKKVNKGDCGGTRRMSNKSYIADWKTNPGCGCLQGTILHELVHHTARNNFTFWPWDDEKQPDAIERSCYPKANC